MTYFKKQINKILVNEGIYTYLGTKIADSFTHHAGKFFLGVADALSSNRSPYYKTSGITDLFRGDFKSAIEKLSGVMELKSIGIVSPEKFTKHYYQDLLKYDPAVIATWKNMPDLEISHIIGYKTVQTAYLSMLGYFGMEGSSIVYDKLSSDKQLVQKSTDMVGAINSGDTKTVVNIASSIKQDSTTGMITPDSLNNSNVINSFTNSNPILSKAKEIAIEYPKLYVPILILTMFGLVYLKFKKNKIKK